MRMVHESVVASPAWFVTLTYRTEELPEHGSLFPRDATRFLKRLRRVYEGTRISYYLAGEYGEAEARPHYHAVLYGARFLDRDVFTYRHGAPVYRSQLLEDVWGHGICEFTGLTFAAARYCASYVRKKLRKRDDPDAYLRVNPFTGELVEIEQEYGRMSRRPAIGRRWLERYWRDVYPRDRVVLDGRELKPPRYYDKWMDRFQPRVMMETRMRRYEESKELSVECLRAMEKAHVFRVGLLERRDAQ